MSIDVVQCILDFNRGREPERLGFKYDKMRKDAFTFLRGTCHLFYARLPAHPLLVSAPLVWSCGDLHFENFGSDRGEDRSTCFDINDFDEAALAPLMWDLVRALAQRRPNRLESRRCVESAHRGRGCQHERHPITGQSPNRLKSVRN